MSASAIAALAVFAATYLVIAIGRFPGLRLDRAGAALIGASLMVATGTLSIEEAYRAIDLGTIVLLLGMMIVVANLRLSGFFALIAARLAGRAGHPLFLLGGTILVSGVLSAFLVNDTVCLVLTPLVMELLRRLGRNPVPHLLAIAMASNIGGAATITGNPQNIMIGSMSGISYTSFLLALAPVSLVGLCILFAVFAIIWRGEFRSKAIPVPKPPRPRVNRPLLRKAILVTLAMIVGFFLWGPPAEVAILAGALLLPTRRLKPARVYRAIDWPLLVLFAGLFVVVAGAEKAALTPGVLAAARRLDLDSVAILSVIAAILSNLLSNVPAVLVLKPFIQHLVDTRTAWLTLAMASTLAGNLTIPGSVANIIVIEQARRAGAEIGFWAYFRIGAPVTAFTIAIGVLWLSWR